MITGKDIGELVLLCTKEAGEDVSLTLSMAPYDSLRIRTVTYKTPILQAECLLSVETMQCTKFNIVMDAFISLAREIGGKRDRFKGKTITY